MRNFVSDFEVIGRARRGTSGSIRDEVRDQLPHADALLVAKTIAFEVLKHDLA